MEPTHSTIAAPQGRPSCEAQRQAAATRPRPRRGARRRISSVTLGTLTGASLVSTEELPPGVEQIIPRGSIVAITNPQFVEAEEAEISNDAWILGVVINGQARAYSLNLLNRHEVVNDRIGDTPFAAVW